MFKPDFIVNYDRNSDLSFTLIVHVDYQEYLQTLRIYLSFLPTKIVVNEETCMCFLREQRLYMLQ